MLSLLVVGKLHYVTILFSYWFSITTIENAIVINQKNTKVPIQSFLINWESLVINNRDNRLCLVDTFSPRRLKNMNINGPGPELFFVGWNKQQPLFAAAESGNTKPQVSWLYMKGHQWGYAKKMGI